MALTPSQMIPLGTKAPAFSLPDTVSGKVVSLSDFKEKHGLLVMFICNHCPYVKHIAPELAKIGRYYQDKGIGIVAISANDITTHPDDSPEKMKQEAMSRGYEFPYLYDESQEVAKAYSAACTPDLFLFDDHMKLVYRGQLDDSRPGNNIPVTGKDLRTALDALLLGNTMPGPQRPSIGCNIKWKRGNAPAYA
ncbi:MAG: thioredoxin family protein [Candidatus Hydrogenedentes bacterium]|nr:thioredoxin family protein [Candidatus Hydrogenedentota bacterium]